MNEFERLMNDPVDRRVFLKRMSAAGLGAAALALFAGCGGSDNNNNGVTTIPDPINFPGIPGRSVNEAILNYALTLEILEADLYRQALNLASGLAVTAPLAASDTAYTAPVDPSGLSAGFATAGYLYLKQYAYVEAAHRDFLRTAIQSTGGVAVTGNPNGYKFTATTGTSLLAILQQILPLEETGVRAYLGAAPFFTDFALATTAVSIYSTEARHSAAINYILGNDPGPAPKSGDKLVTPTYPSANTFEYYLDPATVISAVQAYYK